MLTKREFQLPDVPQVTGDPKKDAQAFRDHLLNQQRAILEIFRSFNQPEVTNVDMARLRAAYGILFPTGQGAASTNANTLDDYAESTWTPVLTFATPGDLAVTYSVQVGDYTKIGRLIVASFRINTSAFTWTTGSGAIEITGLPFTASSDANFIWPGALTWGGITKASYTNIVTEVVAGSTFANLTASGSAQAAASLAAADMPTGGAIRLRGQIIYRV